VADPINTLGAVTVKYQYNGVEKFSTVLAWCYLHIDIDTWHTNGFETITFTDEQSYTMFMLKWS
jgi:hypothetical protein